jgi:dTMP kinase
MARKGLKRLKEGLFITMEGPEGCGKSTQSRLLRDYLKKRRYDCVATREPGGTPFGEAVRKILLHSKKAEISSVAELLLFEASRSEVARRVIKPALTRGAIVISDRFNDATYAYQGAAGGLPRHFIKKVDDIATGGLKPDLTILLDIDTAAGLRRARQKGADRMEAKPAAYHRRVRGAYLRLARKEPGRIKVVKVMPLISQTQGVIRREVEIVIQKHKRAG